MPLPKLRLTLADLRRGHFAPLLAALILVLFVLHPILRPFPVMRVALDFSFLVVLVGAAYAVADRRRAILFSVLAVGLSLGASVAGTIANNVVLSAIGDALAVIFFAYITFAILDRVLNTPAFTLDSVFGGVCVYLLLGLVWALIYTMIEEISPGSFAIGSALEAQQPRTIRPNELFLYYSYVTLTTLGYGDISPVSNAARSMAALEAIVGPLFVAILVAWLVSEASSSREGGKE